MGYKEQVEHLLACAKDNRLEYSQVTKQMELDRRSYAIAKTLRTRYDLAMLVKNRSWQAKHYQISWANYFFSGEQTFFVPDAPDRHTGVRFHQRDLDDGRIKIGVRFIRRGRMIARKDKIVAKNANLEKELYAMYHYLLNHKARQWQKYDHNNDLIIQSYEERYSYRRRLDSIYTAYHRTAERLEIKEWWHDLDNDQKSKALASLTGHAHHVRIFLPITESTFSIQAPGFRDPTNPKGMIYLQSPYANPKTIPNEGQGALIAYLDKSLKRYSARGHAKTALIEAGLVATSKAALVKRS